MIEFPFVNISDAVFHHAAQRPEAAALLAGGECLSYGALADAVARGSSYLAALGLQPGERVGLGLGNTIDRVILGLAVMRLGAVSVELPPELPEAVLAARVQRFGLAATFVDAAGPASPARIAVRLAFGWRGTLAHYAPMPAATVEPDQLRILILSSGSTGEPKAVVTTHRQRILRSSLWLSELGDAWGVERPGTLLLLAPGATSLVSQFLTIQLLLGGKMVLLPTFRTTFDMAHAIAGWEDAICPLPPGLIRGFLPLSEPGTLLFPRMQALVSSGQPMASHDKSAAMACLTPHFHDAYGCSGCGIISHAGPAELLAKPGSVGRPVSEAGVEVQIVTPEGEVLPPGIPGFLRVRGPNISLGFFNPDDNLRGAEHFAKGWYYPGEVATLDAAGYLQLQGRIADTIHLPTRTLFPQDIEDIILQHPHVAEAAVVGRPGPAGEELVAFIVARAGFQRPDMTAHYQSLLAAEFRPKFTYHLDALPRTGNGKLDRLTLKAEAARQAMPA